MSKVNHKNNERLAFLPVGAKRLWKEVILVIIGLSLFVSTLIIPYQSFLPAWRYYDNMYNINPGGISSFSVNPSFGSNVQLVLVISGEGGLHLSAKNEENRTVIDQLLTSGSYTFSIPSDSGTYSVSLENGGSSVQSIYWVVWMYYYNSIFQIAGISFSSLAFFMLLAHRENKEEEIQIKPIQIPVIPEVKKKANEDVQKHAKEHVREDIQEHAKKYIEEEKKPSPPSDVVQQAKKFLEDLGD